MKPVIGITPSPSTDALSHGTFVLYAIAGPYVEAVLAAGGIPVVLPPQDSHAGPLLDAVDGLLLSGGGDIEPSRFGADERHPAVYGVSPERDRFELALIDEALRRDLPLLCICRGIQVLNVALGGTLIQDIASLPDAPVHIEHRQHKIGLAPDDLGHAVTIDPESPLRRLTRSASLGVNSYHHQAIDRLAPGIVAIAHAPDGLIEATTLPTRDFVLSVQWHPELMFERHPEQLQLFLALTEAAAAKHLAGVLG